MMLARVLIIAAMVANVVGGVANTLNALRAGLGNGGEFFAVCVLVHFIFLVLLVRIYWPIPEVLDENIRRSVKKIGLWMLLPIGLMMLSGIGMIAFLNTFMSLVAAMSCCLIAALIIRRNLNEA